MDKLHSEALNENMEFWYLKFAFDEDEAIHSGGNIYIVTEQDMIMSMVKTMITDRKKAKECDSLIDVYKKKYIEEKAKNALLTSKIATLKASTDYNNIKEKVDKLFQ